MTTALIGVPAAAIEPIWSRVAPILQRACARSDGRYAVEDIHAALACGDMQLWIAIDPSQVNEIEAACATEIVNYPRERRCGLVFCAGQHPERWLHHLQTIGDWAREQGCVAMEMQGRPGWERLLRDWQKTHVLLTKRL